MGERPRLVDATARGALHAGGIHRVGADRARRAGPVDPQTGVSLRPLPFHAANLLIHVVTACVVYRLLLRLVGRPWPALAGAMLFAMHPVQVESVASVSGIQGLLCGMFGLSAVLQYTHFAAPDPGDRPWLRYAFAVALFVCSVLSKPLGTMVPVIAGLVDVFFLRSDWQAAVRSLWPWVMVALPYLILTKSIQPGKQYDVDVPYWTRPFIAADAVTFYLYKLVFPVWLGLFYGRTPGSVLKHNAIFFMWIVPAAIAIALWHWRERLRPLIGAALIFLAGLAPVSGTDSVQLAGVFDRLGPLPLPPPVRRRPGGGVGAGPTVVPASRDGGPRRDRLRGAAGAASASAPGSRPPLARHPHAVRERPLGEPRT